MTTMLRALRLGYRLTDDALCKVWETTLNGKRSIWVVMQRATLPAVRMTQRSKFTNPRAREYLDWKEATQDLVLIEMRKLSIEPFSKGTKLKMDAGFTLTPRRTTVMRKDRKTHTRSTHPANDVDLNNLVKAIEDAMQERVLYLNDKYIFETGHCWKREGDKDCTELWVREL